MTERPARVWHLVSIHPPAPCHAPDSVAQLLDHRDERLDVGRLCSKVSRIAWAKLMARVGEEFPLLCPACGGDIRLRGGVRQEPAPFEPEVRKRAKARKASLA